MPVARRVCRLYPEAAGPRAGPRTGPRSHLTAHPFLQTSDEDHRRGEIALRDGWLSICCTNSAVHGGVHPASIHRAPAGHVCAFSSGSRLVYLQTVPRLKIFSRFRQSVLPLSPSCPSSPHSSNLGKKQRCLAATVLSPTFKPLRACFQPSAHESDPHRLLGIPCLSRWLVGDGCNGTHGEK